MRTFVTAAAVLSLACFAQIAASAPPREIHVAAAANLTLVLPDLAGAFERKAGIHVVPSFGATAQLTQQIENGAPYDVFLSADVEHADQLVKGGFAPAAGRIVYARGQLVVWAPKHPELRRLEDLANPAIRAIAVAKPELAPYGSAAIETLKKSGVWEKVEKKIVYAPSIAVAKQFADTGNAEAAFTALALAAGQTGNYFPVDETLHQPINQALCIMSGSKDPHDARAFVDFVTGAEGGAILKRFGYGKP